jgi:DNA-binding winged helix-turn-helix (wHTH) protein/tetratricopeptide (TPR) repeat protein
MHTGKETRFGRFRLDLTNECLWLGSQAVFLRPKAFAVLKLLVQHAGQLVTKQQVLDAVWPDTFVGDAVLKDVIRQLRNALRDDAASPAYIETAHRRGYRFIAKLSKSPLSEVPDPSGHADVLPLTPEAAAPGFSAITTGVLGREVEFGKMQGWLDRALSGERQIVFVTGEPGIGKTSIVQTFVEQARDIGEIRVVRGQCLEQYGAGEPYLPVLDGFSRLCRESGGATIIDLFRQLAPAWLAQMSSLLPPSERDTLQAPPVGKTREGMLREMAEMIEALSLQSPLVLILEDLHWSDYSTIDLVSYLARRRDPARLMVIGTYRPVDVILHNHPVKGVKRELQAHGLCQELPLEYLDEEAVAEYLAAKFPSHRLPSRLRQTIYRRTGGNPLFIVNLVEYLIDQKMVSEDEGTWRLRVDLSQIEQGIPSSLRELIEKQIERLGPDERNVLEGASVAGMECCSVAIAAGLDMPVPWVEERCESLARKHEFLSPSWLVQLPDGTLTPRHRFNHVLYLEVAYSRIPAMRRAQIHHRIGERGVAVYGERAGEIAAELAMHFEQSRDWPSALKYLIQAAENATNRFAHHEAADLARRGLEVLKSLPSRPEGVQQEIKLRILLGVSLMSIKGFASTEVEDVYGPGRELFWRQGPSPELFHMLWSLNLYYQFSGKVQSSLEISEQLLQLAESLNEGALIMEAHRSVGATLVILGRFTEALEHLDKATALYATQHNHRFSALIGRDCKVISECFAARALWALGYADEAAARTAGALQLARKLGSPQTLLVAEHFAAQIHQLSDEASLVYERAKDALRLADEYGLELWVAYGLIELGWAEAELGNTEHGIEQMQRGVAAYEATGAKLWSSYYLQLLADQLAKAGRVDEGLAIIAKALTYAEQSGETFSLAELYRIKGELILKADERPLTSRRGSFGRSRDHKDSAVDQARCCFERALEIAKRQQAGSWELGATQSLNRLEPERRELTYAYRAG